MCYTNFIWCYNWYAQSWHLFIYFIEWMSILLFWGMVGFFLMIQSKTQLRLTDQWVLFPLPSILSCCSLGYVICHVSDFRKLLNFREDSLDSVHTFIFIKVLHCHDYSSFIMVQYPRCQSHTWPGMLYFEIFLFFMQNFLFLSVFWPLLIAGWIHFIHSTENASTGNTFVPTKN